MDIGTINGSGSRVLLLTLLLLTCFGGGAWADDLAPSSGIWMIDEERTGSPGRGFSLVAAGDTVVMAMCGYDETGAAKWWYGYGRLTPGTNRVQLTLREYADGMAFGDPLTGARDIGPVGEATLLFSGFTAGLVCLPSEPCKAARQVVFGYADGPEELLGTWALVSESLKTGLITGSRLELSVTSLSDDPNFTASASGLEYVHEGSGVSTNTIACHRLADGYRATFADPPDYFCESRHAGELLAAFFMKFNRNGFHSISADPDYLFRGVRLSNPDGRQVAAD